MPLQAQQIVARACAIARVPGFTVQAGEWLNVILSDLCETYDFDVAKTSTAFNFNTGLPAGNALVQPGSGPYPLPSDYLRCDPKDFLYTIQQVPYFPVYLSPAQFDATVQQAGLATYPYWYTTDMSTSPPGLYVYPPPSGNYPCFMRYRRQMPDITTPESSTAVPWFPNQQYLITRLSGEMMRESKDPRAAEFLGEDPTGAMGILRRYLELKDDTENFVKTVGMSRQRFGNRYGTLPNTKTVGW